MAKIGIIGGSGLDNPEILKEPKDLEVDTPYGEPSAPLKIGKINDVEVIILARHGRAHTIPPTQVNFRANIHALKEQGCTHILATTAVGSLREEIDRGDLVILNQFIDFTRLRKISFTESFEPHKPIHTPMAEPFDKILRNQLNKTCQELNLKHHQKGTVVTIEGPRFSTKAESHMFRNWGADVINMSIAPEAALANEAKIPYAAVAMSTDYDCWKEDETPVSWEEVLKVFTANVEKVTSLLTKVIPKINNTSPSEATNNSSPEINPAKTISPIEEEEEELDLKSSIKTTPHWPKPGIMFRDISSMLRNPKAFQLAVKKLKERYQDQNITKIAAIDSRGFIFGGILAQELNLPLVLIRKKGKLPPEVVSQEYQLEYGTDTIEIHKDAIDENDNVLVLDDLLATGGTLSAACQLVQKLGGKVHEAAIIIDLPDLKGREKLNQFKVFSLVEFAGE